MSRYVRYWYTYRIAVAVLIALVLTGSMFWLYTQQLTCDTHANGCLVNISVHPEDRFVNPYDPNKPISGVAIVGIDDASVSRSVSIRCPAISTRPPLRTSRRRERAWSHSTSGSPTRATTTRT